MKLCGSHQENSKKVPSSANKGSGSGKKWWPWRCTNYNEWGSHGENPQRGKGKGPTRQRELLELSEGYELDARYGSTGGILGVGIGGNEENRRA